jgi:hypothetical protein
VGCISVLLEAEEFTVVSVHRVFFGWFLTVLIESKVVTGQVEWKMEQAKSCKGNFSLL